MRPLRDQFATMIEATTRARKTRGVREAQATASAHQRRAWRYHAGEKTPETEASAGIGILALLTGLSCLCAMLAAPTKGASAGSSSSMRWPSVRPVLTPSTEFGGMPVIYAGAGDGSWPDQMEPNDGADDLLGPAPIEVGTLYRSLNLLPRTQPAPVFASREDRDWYVWNVSGGHCYRAFTGDVAGSVEQLTGKWKVQHAIGVWWYPPVKEGRKLLSQYNPSMGPAEGGYFASARACAEVNGQMAAEVFNYHYHLRDPRGATYTFAVVDVGSLVIAPPTPPIQPVQPVQPGLPSNGGGSYNPGFATSRPARLPAPQEQATPRETPPPTPTATAAQVTQMPYNALTPGPAVPTVLASPSPSPVSPASPASLPSPSQRPGSPGLPASVDVVAYLDQNQNGAPDPGEGLHDLRVALLNVRTNSVQRIVSTNTDGYARLEWPWAGRVRVSLPDLNWSDLVDPRDMASASRPRSDVWSTAEDGGLYLEVRVLPSVLPAVIP